MAACVLVVEDERKIRDLLRDYLEHDGLDVITTGSGAEAIRIARETRPDLIMLDLRLPDVPGEEVAREIRSAATTPIMMLTAKTDAGDRIHGLELGADDYVTKPFSPRELVARVRAVLRRSEPSRRDPEEAIHLGELHVDPLRREVRVAEETVQLTAREFDLLAHFVENKGIVRTRQQLLDAVWGAGWFGDERTVDVHVRQLRRKLGDALPLATVWGVGYRCG